MVEDIVRAAREAAAILANIQSEGRNSSGEWLIRQLKTAVCTKLMIPETEETNIRRLVIMSIKRQDLKSQNLPDAVIEKQIRRYDCHQTSLAAQRKVLLILFVEKGLGIHFTDEEAVEIETIDDLAERTGKQLREG